MAQINKEQLKAQLAVSGKTFTTTDVINLIDSLMGVGDTIDPSQIIIDNGAIAQEVINNTTFQEQFAINKVDSLDSPNSTDVTTSKAVADAVNLIYDDFEI